MIQHAMQRIRKLEDRADETEATVSEILATVKRIEQLLQERKKGNASVSRETSGRRRPKS